MTTNIHPHPKLTFTHLIQLQADHGLVLQRKQGDRFIFRKSATVLTGPGLNRVSAALKAKAAN